MALSNLLLFDSVYFPVLLARADHHVDISRSDQEMFAKTPLYSNKFLLQSKTMAQSMSNESGQPTASFASSQALHPWTGALCNECLVLQQHLDHLKNWGRSESRPQVGESTRTL